MLSKVIRCTLSGSFRKDRAGLMSSYNELVSNGCQVLSPHRIEFDEQEFVRDIAEAGKPIRIIEDHHLMSIKQSDFLWLHAPGGYIGNSTSMEIGFAIARNIPIFTSEVLQDQMLGCYVQVVPSVFKCLESL